MTMPIDRLTTIIQSFSQEMSYGGYILKYMGDINCARSMIRVVQQGINPILEQYGYPDIGVRIGIDFGDQNAVLQYGWNIIHRLNSNNSTHNQQIIKSPHYDIIGGYTVNVAVKMTGRKFESGN